MAESTVIKEFLVALGFKTDESALKKFTGGVTAATKAVTVLGTAIEATAIAVAVGVARFASNLEQLYFAAQRTGSSADNLKAFGLAARNFGASMDEAQGSVEGLAAFLRNHPGGNNFVASLLGQVGLSARGANGEMLQGVDLIAQLGRMFKILRDQGQTFRASQIAGTLGISDRTMLALSTEGFATELAQQERRAAGWQKTAEAAHRFMIQLEDLKLSFQQMLLGFEGPAMGALQRLMTSFGRFLSHHGTQAIRDLTVAFDWLIAGMGRLLDWLDAHGDEIQKRIDEIFGQFKKTFDTIKPAMAWLYDQFVKLDSVTDGWSTKIFLLLAGLKAIGATGIVTGILGIGAAFAKAAGATLGLAADAGGWGAAGMAFGLAAWAALGVGLGYLLDKYFPNNPLAKFGSWEGEKIHDWAERFGNFMGGQTSKFREFRADAVYADNPNRAQLDAKYSPHFEITVNTTVHGSTDPKQTAHYVQSETEQMIRRQAADLVREFAAVVQ